MERLELAGIRIEAHSVGGIETCIHLPDFKVAFDVGRCPEEVVKRDTLLFTHGHMDHFGGVAYHCATRALRCMKPPTYVVPRTYAPLLERLFDAWRAIDHSTMPHTTLSLDPGEELELRSGLVARPFPVDHTAPAQGYALWSRREKLRPEFHGRSGEELRRLRVDEGVEITSVVETPEVAYCGDTTARVLERCDVVRRARLLVLEATFVDERVSPEKARANGHVHLDDLAERAHLFENEAVLLHHFSARYRAREVEEAVDARLPADLRARVTCLLGAHH